MLKLGSTGEDVKILQRRLGLIADGVFGPNTEKKVIEWQKSNGLNPDGIVGKMTWDKMKLGLTITEVKITNTPNNEKSYKELLSTKLPKIVLDELDDVIEKYGGNSRLRMSHFLSQCAHESGNFKAVQENLNYSSKGLLTTFKKYFPGNLSESYAKQPEKIASRVYGNRLGNGDESTKEGWKYRGRGYIQLTGKSNYKKFTDFIGEDCVKNPDLVSEKYPLISAAFFFNVNNLWSICDKGDSIEVITELTKRINGGTNGLNDRIKKFNEFYKILKK